MSGISRPYIKSSVQIIGMNTENPTLLIKLKEKCSVLTN
jgi:hypothetical protein